MYSTNNEGKSIVAERFIRTLKTKIYKYMTSISKNVYIDKLDDIVNKYNNTYHSTIKMKPVDVKFLVILKAKKLLERFTKSNYKYMLNMINYMLNGKVMIVLLTVGLIRKT